MKKRACIFACILLLAAPLFATNIGFEFGLGSGYVFYGSNTIRNRNKQLSDPAQVVLNMQTGLLYKIAPQVHFCLGFDSMSDMRWSGGTGIHMIDYAGLAGFHVYPGLAGLALTVEYALGRRTDFISLHDGDDDEVHHTQWGNGFKCGLAYDFAYKGEGWAPIVGASWRHMPRGGSNDDIIAVFLKFGNK